MTALTSLDSVQIIALCLIGIGTVGLVALILIRRLVPVRAEGRE